MTEDRAEVIRPLLHQGIDFGALLLRLWRTRRRNAWWIAVPSLGFLILGLVLPRWYRSGATFTVDAGPVGPNVSGSIVGLASQLGLGGPSGVASPQFYVELLESRTLRERIIKAPFPIGPHGERRTLEQVWGKIEQPDGKARAAALATLAKHFSSSADARTGVISFTLDGPSPTAAKLMADTALAALNDIVVAIRRKRAAAERRFLEERWEALHDSLTVHEDALRKFYERNRQAVSPGLQFEELRLRREVDRVQGVYVQIGTQLEQARVQEVRDIPAISTIDLPLEPVRKSSPKIAVLVVAGAILGGVGAVGLALAEAAGQQLKHRS